MKKILSLLAMIAVASSSTGFVSACDFLETQGKVINSGANNPYITFDCWNLNSWGNDKKTIINKAYLKGVKRWYKIDQVWHKFKGDESFVLEDAFQLINKRINVWTDIKWSYSLINNSESSIDRNNDLKQLLNKGIELHVSALDNSHFMGTFHTKLKGLI